MTRRKVVLVQLPIPPLGPAAIRGNVPLAGAYLKLWAEKNGLGSDYDIEVFSGRLANAMSDRGLVAALLERDPWMVGFTCYVWNIERTLWLASQLKSIRPDLRIVLGGPEITADNAWVLDTPDYDHAVIGEGEQTFAALLEACRERSAPGRWALPRADSTFGSIPGLYVPPSSGRRFDPARKPAFRTPLADLGELGSPYLAGILDVADEQMLLLETTRGCVFKCKFCYYPKSYDKQYYLAPDLIRASLRHARERGAREVFLLDPTLNQRRDFADLLRLFAEENPGRGLSYFGELRAEGITVETARLLREANFTEVEVGLQSIDPEAMRRMDRKNNLRAFERGIRAMRDEGIRVKVDLIVGLPGDTPDSIRHSFRYLRDGDLYSDVQVFNLAILPGTAFREEAGMLGLRFQPRPPYYVLETPTLDRSDLFGLMQEAQDCFGVEFDAMPAPVLELDGCGSERIWQVELDRPAVPAPNPAERAQAFTLWLRSTNYSGRATQASELVRECLEANPFTTLQVVLEPPEDLNAGHIQRDLEPEVLGRLMLECQANPTYLDKLYALQPGRPNGAKRLVVLLPLRSRPAFGTDWLDAVGELASIVWWGQPGEHDEFEPYEYVLERGEAYAGR